MEKISKLILNQNEQNGRIAIRADGSWDYSQEGMNFLDSRKKNKGCLNGLVQGIINLLTKNG